MKDLSSNEILSLLCDLIRIPSVNPSLAAGERVDEMQIAVFIRNWLEQHGIKASIEEVMPGRPNVYAEIGDGDGLTLCLCAHIDTVGIKEMKISPFEPMVIGSQVYGRGSCDMKGGLAAILSAALALSRQPIEGKLILALVCDEEYSSIGADDFVKKYHADACILTEPSDLHMVVAHKGFLWGRVTAAGKSAHGSCWDIGESAIAKFGPMLVALDAFDKKVLRQRTEALVGPASLHVSLIEGGTGVSTYASTCAMHIERRTLPSEDLAAVKAEIEQVIGESCPSATVDWYFSRPPFACEPNHPIAKCVQKAFQQVCQREPELVGWGVWTDAAIFQAAGIPTVNIGPTGFGLHAPIEWVDIDSVAAIANILYYTTLHFQAHGNQKNSGDTDFLLLSSQR